MVTCLAAASSQAATPGPVNPSKTGKNDIRCKAG